MLSKIKKLVKNNESDIILIIGVVLIALISFGAGRLTAPETSQESIIFQDPFDKLRARKKTSMAIEALTN